METTGVDADQIGRLSIMNAATAARPKVCAVVVTYFPEPGCVENLAVLAPQVGKLIIVDNGSSAQSLALIEAAAKALEATIVRLGRNLGIAAALNVGLRFARDHGYQWLATFDQDSQAAPDMIDEIFRTLYAFTDFDRVAIVAPRPVDRARGVSLAYPIAEVSGTDWRVLPCAGTSGNVIDVQVACDLGGFDESLFIDYVDFEFCLRLRQRGYRILEATRAILLHSLGHVEFRRFIFMSVPVTHHAAIRHYYKSRNRFILWRQYWRQERTWVVRDITWFLFEALFIVLYERQLRTKLPMILSGFRDGLRNVRGAYPPLRTPTPSSR